MVTFGADELAKEKPPPDPSTLPLDTRDDTPGAASIRARMRGNDGGDRGRFGAFIEVFLTRVKLRNQRHDCSPVLDIVTAQGGRGLGDRHSMANAVECR